MGSMLPYIEAPWILWALRQKPFFHGHITGGSVVRYSAHNFEIHPGGSMEGRRQASCVRRPFLGLKSTG